ncbi:hypothetical protein MHU86_23600 [Fragilaria crotonensis]|nr:hypothetical protein MHU86_23600 [Fragilaria crotonensis]
MSEDRERTGSRHQTDEHETQTDEHHDTTQHKIRIAHIPNELESTKTVEASEDDTDDVTVVGFTMKPTVPVPAFIAAAIMDTYVTAPEELALLIVNAIKQRASEDPDPSRATIHAEAASYIPVGPQRSGKLEEDPGTDKARVAASNAYSKRSDEWAKSLHLKHLAVRARSLIRTDDHASTPGRTEDAIQTCQRYWSDRQQTQRPRPPNVEDRL